MSTYVYMKLLESAPERYDAGIARLSHGRIAEVYARIAALAAAPGRRVLDIGCGTGGVTLACAGRGAAVIGIDANAGMLAVAREKVEAHPPDGRVELVELGAMEIEDRFAEGSFDAATACLVMSELLPEERRYVLRTVFARLKPGGRMVVADEVAPRTLRGRVAHALARAPSALLTYLSTQETTHPVRDLAKELRAAGFVDVAEERLAGDTFAIVTGVRGSS